jgi:hypothetical protein
VSVDVLAILSPHRPFWFGTTVPVADLLHSPAEIVRQLLIDLGLGVNKNVEPAGAWPVFYDSRPGDPDSLIVVTDTQGRDFGFSQLDGSMIEHFGFQVYVRARTHEDGWPKARQIATALDRNCCRVSVTLKGTTYCIASVTRSSQVLRLGKEIEATKRSQFSINATVALRMLE